MRDEAAGHRPGGTGRQLTRRGLLAGALFTTAGLAVGPVAGARAADRHRVRATRLATPDGSVELDRITSANRHGLVLGLGSVGDTGSVPMIWTRGGPVVPQMPPGAGPSSPQRSVAYLGDGGQLAGAYVSADDNREHALVWDRFDAAPREVDFGLQNAVASAVNRRGQVVGAGWDNYTGDGALTRPFFYDGGQVVPITPPPDVPLRSSVTGLDERGTALVRWGPSEGNPSGGAYLWRDGAVVADLCALTGDRSLLYVDSNAFGQVVLGHYGLGGDPVQHVYLYDRGTVTTVTNPSGGDATIGYTLTGSVNRPLSDLGHVTATYRSGTSTRSFLWHHGRSTDLGTLGGTYTSAAAVNNLGEVAGTSETADGTMRAFLWRRGELIALDPPGDQYVTTSAAWLTDQGEVLGYARNESGGEAAFTWTVD
jgi:probable HAF family extracellular repeat protein